MVKNYLLLLGGASLAGLAGCAVTRPPEPVASSAAALRPTATQPAVVRAGYREDPAAGKDGGVLPAPGSPKGKADGAKPATAPPPGLPQLTALTLERNPRLSQVGWAVETARGRAV